MKKIHFNFTLKNLEGVEYNDNGTPIFANKLLANLLANATKSEFVSETAMEMAMKLNKSGELELSSLDWDKVLNFIEPLDVIQIIKGQIKLHINEQRRNE